MKILKLSLAFLSVGILLLSCSNSRNEVIIDRGFERAEIQLANQIEGIENPKAYPRTIKDGKLRSTHRNSWTDGFFPGCLWYLYEYENDIHSNNAEFWKDAAIRWTEPLEPLKKLTSHHDIGFLIYCSFGNAYRLTGNETYKDIVIEAANSLCTRFNETTGTIESWNYRKSWNKVDEWFFPVIIDNMMNLELLYFASKATGDPKYRRIADSHAKVTAKNQFREDYSNYHVVDYDTETGKVLHRQTCQGFSDNSMWARGQAWAIYGYTMAYRETKDAEYLDMAIKVADRWLSDSNLPKDGVPYWDFNAGQEGYTPDWDYDANMFPVIPRDASAAAITASGLLELSDYATNGKKYFKAAEHILESLTSPDYLAEKGKNCNFILMHSVGSIPHKNEIDVPLVYADYYYLEALLRYRNRTK